MFFVKCHEIKQNVEIALKFSQWHLMHFIFHFEFWCALISVFLTWMMGISSNLWGSFFRYTVDSKTSNLVFPCYKFISFYKSIFQINIYSQYSEIDAFGLIPLKIIAALHQFFIHQKWVQARWLNSLEHLPSTFSESCNPMKRQVNYSGKAPPPIFCVSPCQQKLCDISW